MNDFFMNTYHRLPVTFTHGEGAYLFDITGKKYLDFTSGIAVNCLGHKYPAIVQAVKAQAEKLMHVCNYYQSDVTLAFAEKLVKACAGAGMKNVFLCNSGAEANEGAIKITRKYSLKKYGAGRHRIVTLSGSFHGRTITTLAATGQEQFHRDFSPFTGGFVHIPGGNIEELDRALDAQTTAGLFIEAIQGECGIVPQSEAFIAAAAELCAERDILLVFDEIQCGLGRTGTFLACEAYKDRSGAVIQPDIVTLAKGLAGGLPAGAVLAGKKAAGVFETGDHGSTFGGSPMAAAAGIAVLDTVTEPAFLADIARKGSIIQETVESWKRPGEALHPLLKEVRGKGLMTGIDIGTDARPVLESCLASDPGLLILGAGGRTLRLLPPYIISDAEITQGLELLRTALLTTPGKQ
jgi:acetylornithine/N-succinyldiaminopimelate aminotransferase